MESFSKIFIFLSAICVANSVYNPYPDTDVYIPQGRMYDIGNLTIYDTGNKAKRLIVAIYSRLAFNDDGRLKEIADTLAENFNFRVVIPDILRGESLPEDEAVKAVWLQDKWANVFKWDLLNIQRTFQRTEHINQAGIFGISVGTFVVTKAVSDPALTDFYAAGALVTPRDTKLTSVCAVKNPLTLMPAGEDLDFSLYYEMLKEKFGDNSGHRRFYDMKHGFVASGDWDDPIIRLRVDEVIYVLGEWFSSNLPIRISSLLPSKDYY